MQIIRWIIAAAIFLTLLLLSLQNAEQVTLRFFNLANLQAPLVFVVFIAFAGGVAAGLLAGAFRAARLKRQLNALRRERLGSDPMHSPLGPDAAPADPATPGAGLRRTQYLGDEL